jgi:hypothetical protein
MPAIITDVSITKLEHALAHAARGWPVFPLKANSKLPATDNGHLSATTDSDTIRAWWTCPLSGATLDRNIGVRPGAGQFAVIDLDTKQGVDGPANYVAAGGVIAGTVCATPSGGLHVYLSGEDIGTSAGRIAPGCDSRGSDGYVVAPGSTIDGKAYEFVSDGPMLPIPDFVRECVPARSERPAPVTTYAIEDDQPRNLERFTDACRRAPGASAGVWHDASRDLACEAVRCAVSVERATEIMLAEWVPKGAQFEEDGRADRWPADVAGSYTWALAQGEHGVHSVDAQLLAFEGMTIVPPPPPEPAMTHGADSDPWHATEASGLNGSRLVGLSPSQCGNMPIPPYIIKGLLAKGQVGVVAALPASGKSCFIPLLAYRLAQGQKVFGRRTSPGRVAYFGLEDERGMAGRIDALRLKYGDAPDFRLFVRARNLLTCPDEREEIKRIVRVGKPDLVIFDTLRAGWAGLAENDADQMGQVVAFARELTTREDGEPGPSVLNVHHTTKAGGQTASGSGVLEADADVTLFLAKDPETNVVTVTMGKNRNGESFGQEMCFGFESVRIGTDQDGDPVTRPVAVEVDPGSVKKQRALAPSERAALAVLEGIVAEAGPDVQMVPADMTFAGILFGGAASVPRDIWAAACDMKGISSATKPQDRARVFRKAMKDLLAHKVILQQGERVLLLRSDDGRG